MGACWAARAGWGRIRVQWQRTIAGYIADAIEPLVMFALAGLALWCRPRSDDGGFLILAAIALALMAARRLDNALVAWTDAIVAAWALAWNRWGRRPWRSVDAAALAIMAAQIGVPGIWFPFGIGVSRKQSLYAILIPLLGVLVARTSSGQRRPGR